MHDRRNQRDHPKLRERQNVKPRASPRTQPIQTQRTLPSRKNRRWRQDLMANKKRLLIRILIPPKTKTGMLVQIPFLNPIQPPAKEEQWKLSRIENLARRRVARRLHHRRDHYHSPQTRKQPPRSHNHRRQYPQMVKWMTRKHLTTSCEPSQIVLHCTHLSSYVDCT